MLKIVHRICCGMDVHKSFIVACIAATNEKGVATYKSKRFCCRAAAYYVNRAYLPAKQAEKVEALQDAAADAPTGSATATTRSSFRDRRPRRSDSFGTFLVL